MKKLVKCKNLFEAIFVGIVFVEALLVGIVFVEVLFVATNFISSKFHRI